MIMIINIELKIVDQIDTSVSFWPKKVKWWNFEGDCVPNGSTGKVATWGVLIYSWNMTLSDEMQNFFTKWSWSALNIFEINLEIFPSLYSYWMVVIIDVN